MDEEIKQEETMVASDKDNAQRYLDNWKRERADFLNYKKDEVRRMGQFAKFANEDVILEVLEIVDDLDAAVKEMPNIGLEQILKKFIDLFKKYGVERIKVEGEKFDPALHEAVAVPSDLPAEISMQEGASGEGWETETEGNKLVEVRSGYIMGGKVIRPVRVKIVK